MGAWTIGESIGMARLLVALHAACFAWLAWLGHDMRCDNEYVPLAGRAGAPCGHGQSTGTFPPRLVMVIYLRPMD